MSKSKKHIDDLFKDGLNGVSTPPPSDIWGAIEGALVPKKKLVPVWRWVAAASVLVAISISALWIFGDRGTELPLAEQTSTNTPDTFEAEDIETPVAVAKVKTVAPDRNSKPAAGKTDTQEMVAAVVKEKSTVTVVPVAYSDEIIAGEYPVTAEQEQNPEFLAPISTDAIPTELSLMLQPVKPYDQINEAEESYTMPRTAGRWSIGGQFSPLYSYRHLTSNKGNAELKDHYNEIEKGMLAYSGGINLQYKASSKITLYSGVYYSRMGQSIDGVSKYTVTNLGWENTFINNTIEKFYLVDNSTGNIESEGKYVKIVNNPNDIYDLGESRNLPIDYSAEAFQNIGARVIQNFDFLEIPLVMKYQIVERRVDVNLIGGFSTSFLVNNDATLYIDQSEYSSVKTDKLNSLNYSGLIGLGFDFEMLPGLQFSMEPTFKYYLNPFSSKNLLGSHPYSMGFLSGIRFNF